MEMGTAWGCGDELVAALSAVTDVLTDLPVSVSRLTGADLDAVVGAVDRLAAVASAARFAVVSEADARGEVAASSAGSVCGWVRERCPSLEAREVGTLARAVQELRVPALDLARAAVVAGRLSVGAGVVVAAEWTQLRPLLQDGAEGPVLAGLVSMGESHGCPGVRSLRPAMLARYGLGVVVQEEQDRRAGLTVLSCGTDIGGGVTEYRMRLTPESRAVVEAALNVLTRPAVVDGARDPRTVDQRRGDALVEVCRRAVTLTDAGATVTAAGVKATVLVSVSLDDLRTLCRPGTLVGGVDGGVVLGPETVRKLACDGAVVPVVLGGEGEVLHLGRTRRLFTSAQVRALWLRDRHCTFPGCTVPATWCDAHHVRHWVDGGLTDLGNGALLCGRHHTLVHRDRLTATLTPTGVEWDRLAGSYDRAPPGTADAA
jgi:hypothetical protein